MNQAEPVPFSSYKAILIFSFLFTIISLIYYYNFAQEQFIDKYSKLAIFISVFLNGGLLLWTNSVRWYAYWVPLFIIFYTYLLKKETISTKNIIWISVALSFMTYINYLSFFLVTVFSLYLFLFQGRSIGKLIILYFIYGVFCSYQIFIFLTVQIYNKEGQISSFFSSFFNFIYGVINGGSVFIADPFFLFFSIITLVIMILGFNALVKQRIDISIPVRKSFVLLLGMAILMILSGVSGKYRNNIGLSIPFYFILASLIEAVKDINIKRLYIFSAVMISVISAHNLVTRHNTSKNSYNLPVTQFSDMLKEDQTNRKVVFTHEPALKFHLKNRKYNVHDLHDKNNKEVILDKGTHVVTVHPPNSTPKKKLDKKRGSR